MLTEHFRRMRAINTERMYLRVTKNRTRARRFRRNSTCTSQQEAIFFRIFSFRILGERTLSQLQEQNCRCSRSEQNKESVFAGKNAHEFPRQSQPRVRRHSYRNTCGVAPNGGLPLEPIGGIDALAARSATKWPLPVRPGRNKTLRE